MKNYKLVIKLLIYYFIVGGIFNIDVEDSKNRYQKEGIYFLFGIYMAVSSSEHCEQIMPNYHMHSNRKTTLVPHPDFSAGEVRYFG